MEKCNYFHIFVILEETGTLKEKDRKQLKRNQNEPISKPSSFVQISCKSDYKQESYWRLNI